MAIRNITQLHQHLQWAVEIEHSVIPPYLFALYSLKEGTNRAAFEVIESVFMEEMLHMTLACNIMNAVGGSPKIDKHGFIPHYPAFLPHSDRSFQVGLERFSKEAVQTFMHIEKPQEVGAVPEDDKYETFGQFFDALEQGLKALCAKLGEDAVFTGDPARQVRAESSYYGGSGRIIAVTNLETALAALDEIKEQGEGLKHETVWDGDKNMFHPEKDEVAHYFRFHELIAGKGYQQGDTPESGPTGEALNIDWDGVYPVRPNPRSADYPKGSPIREAMDDFNRTYSGVLHLLHETFNGKPEFLAIATGAMYEIKIKAIELMKMPSGDGETTVGPSFEYIPHEDRHIVQKIIVRRNGPYVVYGGIPLVRKAQVISEHGEPLTWKKKEVLATEGTYALCRCGQSSAKPFCDGTHARVRFNGTETADTSLSVQRQIVFEGVGLTMKNDSYVCMESGFCGNRIANVRQMIKHSDDTQVRATIISMIERCPSGAFTYRLTGDDTDLEPDLPREIAVTTEGDLAGALWVTGNIPIERADGQPLEVRNRVTLCRCGASSKKPLCDGTHREQHFTED